MGIMISALSHLPEQKALFQIINFQARYFYMYPKSTYFLTRVPKSMKVCLPDYSCNLSSVILLKQRAQYIRIPKQFVF